MSNAQERAIAAVTKAVDAGIYPRLAAVFVRCVDCGKRARVYDHRDYSRVLKVSPVCRSCNRLRGNAKNWNPRNTPRRPILLNLPKGLYERLRRKAFRRRVSMTELATSAIAQALGQKT